MSQTVQTQRIDPSRLAADTKQALIDELYATHCQIFDGVSKQVFANYVVNSPAQRTRIEVLRVEGEVVGYTAVHTFVREIAGQRRVVIRAESGKLPAYRRSANGALIISEILRACLRYPQLPKAFLSCLIHPSSYLALGHVAPQIYPSPKAPTPTPIQALMDEFADSFGLECVDPEQRSVRKVGWITRESDHDRVSWSSRSDDLTRFFIRQNPGYVRGHGLVTYAPIRLPLLIDGSLRHLARTLRRRIQRDLTPRLIRA